MPQVKIIPTPRFIRDLERMRLFLREKSPSASRRVATVVSRAIEVLQHQPEAFRFSSDAPQFREMVIPFGDSGYVVLYDYHEEFGKVRLLAIKHQKEDDYI